LLENKLLVLQVQEVAKRNTTTNVIITVLVEELRPIMVLLFQELKGLTTQNMLSTPAVEKRRIEELTARNVKELMPSKSNSNPVWLIIVNILKIYIKALIK